MYIHTCVDTVLARRAAIHVVVHSAPLPASRSGIGDSFDIYIYIYIYSHVYIYIYIYVYTNTNNNNKNNNDDNRGFLTRRFLTN